MLLITDDQVAFQRYHETHVALLVGGAWMGDGAACWRVCLLPRGATLCLPVRRRDVIH